jgi:hypothetical protein
VETPDRGQHFHVCATLLAAPALRAQMIEEKEGMLQRCERTWTSLSGCGLQPAQMSRVSRHAERSRRLLLENKTKLRQVEEELSLLQRDIKMTSAPKKQAMELMRKKIEVRPRLRLGCRPLMRIV